MMENFIITIGRQAGSGGREVGMRLAQRLGIPYYGRQELMQIAKGTPDYEEVQSFYEEQPVNSLLYALAMGMDQEQLGQAPFSQIRRLADQGSCVFVGRCADYILGQRKNHLSVFIYAPLESRVQVCMERFGMDEKTARMMTVTVDRARQDYHMTFARCLPHDMQHKDLLINSQALGVEKTACLLRDLVQIKFGGVKDTEEAMDRARRMVQV